MEYEIGKWYRNSSPIELENRELLAPEIFPIVDIIPCGFKDSAYCQDNMCSGRLKIIGRKHTICGFRNNEPIFTEITEDEIRNR